MGFCPSSRRSHLSSVTSFVRQTHTAIWKWCFTFNGTWLKAHHFYWIFFLAQQQYCRQQCDVSFLQRVLMKSVWPESEKQSTFQLKTMGFLKSKNKIKSKIITREKEKDMKNERMREYRENVNFFNMMMMLSFEHSQFSHFSHHWIGVLTLITRKNLIGTKKYK